MAIRLQFLPLFTICLALGLSACHFKKGGDDTSSDGQTTQSQPQQPQGPKNIFDAMAMGDERIALAYIENASSDQIDSFKDDGSTPLYYAALNSKISYVDALLKKGALPLKPNRGVTDTAYSAALQIQKSGLVIEHLEKKIATEREQIISLISKGMFNDAYKFTTSYYFNFAQSLDGKSSFLDLVYQNRSQNMSDATAVTLKLLPGNYQIETVRALWSLAFETNSLDLLKGLVQTKPVIDDSALNSLILNAQVPWMTDALQVLNDSGRTLNLNLADLEMIYVKSIINNAKSSTIETNRIKRDFFLLEKNSSNKTFCSDCVQLILPIKELQSGRLEIIKSLIAMSGGSDTNIISSIVSQVNASELREILLSMTPEMLKQQQYAFQTILADEEISDQARDKVRALKESGISLNSAERKNLFSRLLKSNSTGQKNAITVLGLLSSDLQNIRYDRTFSSRDIQLLATQEIYRLISHKEMSYESIQLLMSINGQKFSSLLISTNDKEENDVNVSLKYVLEKEDYEKHASKDRIDQLFRDLGNYISENDSAVWFKIQGENGQSSVMLLSSLDMAMISLIKSDLEREKAFSAVISKINFLVSINLPTDPRASDIFKNLWTKSDATEKSKFFNRYIFSLSKANLTETTQFIFTYLIREMPFNFSNQRDVISSILAEKISKRDDSSSAASLLLFKTYLQRQNPRLYVALHGHLDSYKRYVKGDLASDPLCNGNSGDINLIQSAYKTDYINLSPSDSDKKNLNDSCASADELAKSQVTSATSNSSANWRKSLSELGAEMSRQRQARKTIYPRQLGNEIKWISTLNDLRSQLTVYEFDSLDIFGLKASDLPMEVYQAPQSDFLGN